MKLDFDDIFRDHAKALWRMAVRLTGTEADAWDVVQTAFVKAMSKGGYKGKASVRAWLMSIARNEALDRLRRRGKVEVPWPDREGEGWMPEGGQTPLADLLDQEDYRNLHMAFTQLPAATSELLALKYQDGLSADEIAAVVGMKPGAVRTAMHRAIAKLKENLSHVEHKQLSESGTEAGEAHASLPTESA